MRTIKELLQLMLNTPDNFDDDGLCMWSCNLWCQDLITSDEYELVKDYIYSNRPSKYSSFDAFRHSDTRYFWKKGNIQPRIKWLKKHIQLN